MGIYNRRILAHRQQDRRKQWAHGCSLHNPLSSHVDSFHHKTLGRKKYKESPAVPLTPTHRCASGADASHRGCAICFLQSTNLIVPNLLT